MAVELRVSGVAVCLGGLDVIRPTHSAVDLPAAPREPGAITNEDVLAAIFSQFCIGK